MEDTILDYVAQLFTNFGWWFLAIVAVTTLVMIPLNKLIEKLFSKSNSASASRLAKTTSQVLVFIVSGLAITIFSLILEHKVNFEFVLVNVVPTGVCAMALWAVIKIARDLGLRDFLVYLANNAEVDKLLSKIKINSSVKNAVYKSLKELINNTDGDNADVVITKATELQNRATQMLQGFVENPAQVATQFVTALQTKYAKKEEK